jgi:hypothetical protein
MRWMRQASCSVHVVTMQRFVPSSQHVGCPDGCARSRGFHRKAGTIVLTQPERDVVELHRRIHDVEQVVGQDLPHAVGVVPRLMVDRKRVQDDHEQTAPCWDADALSSDRPWPPPFLTKPAETRAPGEDVCGP